MNFDASMLVIIAIFGVCYLVLKLALFDPLLAILARRERRIGEARRLYEEALREAETQLDAERGKLNAARREAAGRREALRREAQEQSRAMVEAARAAAQTELERVRADIAAQVEAERGGLEARAAGLADEMAGRLLGRAV